MEGWCLQPTARLFVLAIVWNSHYSEAGLKTGVKFYFYSLEKKKQRKEIKWDVVLVWVIVAITEWNHSEEYLGTNENFSFMVGVCRRNKKVHKSAELGRVHPSSWRVLLNQGVSLHQCLNLQTPNVANKKLKHFEMRTEKHDWNESLHDGAPQGSWGEQNIILWMFHLSFSHYHALTSAVSRLLWNEEMLLCSVAALTFTPLQLFSLLTLHLQQFHTEQPDFFVIVLGVHLEHRHKKPFCFQQSVNVWHRQFYI